MSERTLTRMDLNEALFREVGLSLGFEHVESSPLVRSSYHAEKHI